MNVLDLKTVLDRILSSKEDEAVVLVRVGEYILAIDRVEINSDVNGVLIETREIIQYPAVYVGSFPTP